MADHIIECVKPKGFGSRKTYTQGCDSPTQLGWEECDVVIAADQVSGGRTSFHIVSAMKSEPIEDARDGDLDPFDFNYFLGMQELDDQAKSMGRDNPFDGSAQAILDKHYEAGHDEEDDDSIPF